jgi:nitroreductase
VTRGIEPDAGLELLFRRRSVSNLTEPGPSPDQLETLLRAATTVPDHGLLRPWRFVVVSAAARSAFGDALAAAAASTPGVDAAAVEKVRRKPLIAPTQLVLIARPAASAKVPEWEQVASAACTGYALMLAAQALGLGAVWKSTPFRDGTALRRLLGMAGGDQLLGWVNVGTPGPGALPPRPAVPLSEVAGVLGAAGELRAYSAGGTPQEAGQAG